MRVSMLSIFFFQLLLEVFHVRLYRLHYLHWPCFLSLHFWCNRIWNTICFDHFFSSSHHLIWFMEKNETRSINFTPTIFRSWMHSTGSKVDRTYAIYFQTNRTHMRIIIITLTLCADWNGILFFFTRYSLTYTIHNTRLILCTYVP